jgi:U3 small nucleolar RNA-associated protein 22
MKRKRGPAPKGRKKKVRTEEETEETEEWGGIAKEKEIVNDEAEFEEFSIEDEEVPESAAPAPDGAGGPTARTARKKRHGEKAVPTQEEIMDLFFSSTSFQSNLFKLQVDELLSEVRVKYDKMDKVEGILHRLRDVLLQLPDSEEQLVLRARTY